MPSLDIVIVNWNSRHQLRDCLESLVKTDTSNLEINRVVVVDNGSTDGSASGLENLNLPLSFIRNAGNLGFSKAVNQGIEGSQTDYILLLNPDTRLFAHSLSKPIDFMQQPVNQQIGILGVQIVDSQNQVILSCAHFPSAFAFFTQAIGLDHALPKAGLTPSMWEWDHKTSRSVDHVMAAYYLTRREVFESVGKMDERFFVYYEDLDFSLRAKQAGWQSYYFTDVQIYHKSGGCSEQIKARRLLYSLASRIRYAYKHFSWIEATAYTIAVLFIEPLTRIGYALLKVRPVQLVDTLKAYVMLWKSLIGRISFDKNV